MKQIQKGFTLIELMIVVAIIGILAAVAIPAYQDYVTKAKLSKVTSTLDPLKMALSMYQQENGSFPSAAAVVANYAAAPVATSNSLWSSIGLQFEPTVPVELASIQYDGGSATAKLTLTFAATGVGTGVDTKTLVQVATLGGTGVTWACDATSSLTTANAGAVARKYFKC